MLRKIRKDYYLKMEGFESKQAMLMIYLANDADTIKKRKHRIDNAISHLNNASKYLDKYEKLNN